MPKTADAERSSLLDQLKTTINDGVDYALSGLQLVQARLTELALSSLVFTVMLGLSTLLILAAFIVLNIALGMWLAQLWGSALISLVILGTFYALLAVGLGAYAFRWLGKLRS